MDPTPFNTLFERNYRAHSFVISTDGPWRHTHYDRPVVSILPQYQGVLVDVQPNGEFLFWDFVRTPRIAIKASDCEAVSQQELDAFRVALEKTFNDSEPTRGMMVHETKINIVDFLSLSVDSSPRGLAHDLVMIDQAAFAPDLPHHEPCGHSQLTKWRQDKWLKERQQNRMWDKIIAEALDTAGNKFAGCFNHVPEFCACGRRHDQHFSFRSEINAQPWEKPSPQELDGLIDKVREAWTPDAPS